MTTSEVMAQLETLGNTSRLKSYLKYDRNYQGYGVMSGELRKLGKKMGINHQQALELWRTKNTDAMMLATMLFEVKDINIKLAQQLANDIYYCQTADELVFNTLYKTNFAQQLEDNWLPSPKELIGRCGFNLAIMKILNQQCDDQCLDYYLKIIEEEMLTAPYFKQWTMNRVLSEIGIRYPHYTNSCLSIGEKLGVYKDVKVSKGCTSPYAVAWINAGIAKRKKV